MKARLARKILGADNGKNAYWLNRVVRVALCGKEDHRVIKALQIYFRKARKKKGGSL